MADSNPSADGNSADYVAFEDFRQGLPLGRFRIVVNPALAPRFVAQRLNVTPVAIAAIGCGIAAALAGHALGGALLVAAGVLLRRVVKWQAAKILLHLASRHTGTYYDATASAVMEVRRV